MEFHVKANHYKTTRRKLYGSKIKDGDSNDGALDDPPKELKITKWQLTS